jgi:hypothetical protein
VRRATFRVLLAHLCTYACWQEVFHLLTEKAAGGNGRREALGSGAGHGGATDLSVRRHEWAASVGKLRELGRTWAPYARLIEAQSSDFDVLDRSGRGHFDFGAFVGWMSDGEVEAGTPVGAVLPMSLPTGWRASAADTEGPSLSPITRRTASTASFTDHPFNRLARNHRHGWHTTSGARDVAMAAGSSMWSVDGSIRRNLRFGDEDDGYHSA